MRSLTAVALPLLVLLLGGSAPAQVVINELMQKIPAELDARGGFLLLARNKDGETTAAWRPALVDAGLNTSIGWSGTVV